MKLLLLVHLSVIKQIIWRGELWVLSWLLPGEHEWVTRALRCIRYQIQMDTRRLQRVKRSDLDALEGHQ